MTPKIAVYRKPGRFTTNTNILIDQVLDLIARCKSFAKSSSSTRATNMTDRAVNPVHYSLRSKRLRNEAGQKKSPLKRLPYKPNPPLSPKGKNNSDGETIEEILNGEGRENQTF